MLRINGFGVTLTLLASTPIPTWGQSREPGLGAVLFGYRVDVTPRSAFDRAYQAHLAWHEQAGDTLVWYAWDVITGDRVGLFVDGVFGAPLRAVDQRVDPAGDAQNFEAVVGPLAAPAFRTVYAALPHASTDLFLEEGRPARMVQAYHLRVRPGQGTALEERLSELRESQSGAPFSVYRTVDGGRFPSYVILAPRDGFRSLAGLAELFGPAWTGWEMILSARSELWRYRADLTYLPARRR